MKIEKIAYNKIKVTVTALDMIKMGVTLDNFVQDTPEARELFRSLIKRAEFETGFSCEDSRVVVEAIPSKYDGLVLFVTRLESELFDAVQIPKKPKIRAKAPRQRRGYSVFKFDDLENLIECAAAGDSVTADLYGYLGAYCLIVYGDDDVCTYFSEYGDRLEDYEYALPKIREHGTLIAQGDAIEVIKKQF